jgi:hypothetical protein
MKTIEKNGEIRRTDDINAERKVKSEGWAYCPKSKWKGSTKVQVPDTGIVVNVEVEKKIPYQKKKKS